MRTADVIQAVCEHYSTSPAALRSRSRQAEIRRPRQVAMFLCSELEDVSLAEIGRLFDRDHPSVRNAISTIERHMRNTPAFAQTVQQIRTRAEGVAMSAAQPPPPRERVTPGQALSRARVVFKSGTAALEIGRCAYGVQPHPITMGQQLVATLVNYVFEVEGGPRYVIPHGDVAYLELEEAQVAVGVPN